MKQCGDNCMGDKDVTLSSLGEAKAKNTIFYHRISSHYNKTTVKEEGKKQQFGFDYADGLFPGKATVLVGLRKTVVEGKEVYSTFIKPERHGCPPFWKEGLRTGENAKAFLGHATGYIDSVKKLAGLKKWNATTRTEKLNPAMMNSIKRLCQEGILSKHEFKILKKASKQGVQKLFEKIDDTSAKQVFSKEKSEKQVSSKEKIESINSIQEVQELRQTFKVYRDRDIEIGVSGIRQCFETVHSFDNPAKEPVSVSGSLSQ